MMQAVIFLKENRYIGENVMNFHIPRKSHKSKENDKDVYISK